MSNVFAEVPEEISLEQLDDMISCCEALANEARATRTLVRGIKKGMASPPALTMAARLRMHSLAEGIQDRVNTVCDMTDMLIRNTQMERSMTRAASVPAG